MDAAAERGGNVACGLPRNVRRGLHERPGRRGIFRKRGPTVKIVLVSPKGPLYRHRGGVFKKSLRYAPLTLPTLAGLVPPELGAEIRIIDEGIHDIDPEAIQADLVGMTVITGSARRAYDLAEPIRRRGIPVVMGGPHPTLVPEDVAPHADAVVVGYAEQSWPRLLRELAAGRMQPRYDPGPDHTLRGLPMPRWDLVDASRYTTTNVFEATRGCVHDCDFCVVPAAWGRVPYKRPVEEVAEEIRRRGARKLIFIDLNLISERDHARRLFEALVPLGVRWFGLSTALLGRDPELMDVMQRSGCSGLLIGFESISRDSLRCARKGFNSPQDYRQLVADLHRRGIAIMGCFVFGVDEDGPEVFEATARYVVEVGIDLPRFAITTPFPGTRLHRRLAAEGRILTRDWNLYDGQHVVFRPARMSPRQLQEGHESAWRHAYRWGSIARRLARSEARGLVTLAANLGYRYYAHHLHTHYTCDWFIGQVTQDRRVSA
ncbi:MAG: B12-binding domain-containing radical SAM protein [Planctomycetes bacterium]|nr:B12-binding domain-containing radical SAM protein [Planctomycetota bacterium]